MIHPVRVIESKREKCNDPNKRYQSPVLEEPGEGERSGIQDHRENQESVPRQDRTTDPTRTRSPGRVEREHTNDVPKP